MPENQPNAPIGEADRLRAILKDPNLLIKNNTGILTRLFRKLLNDLNITVLSWERLMDAYVTDPRAGVPKKPGYESSEKTNLRKRLNANSMTWKSLLKGLDFLQCSKTIFTVEVNEHYRGHCRFSRFKGKVNGLFEVYGQLLNELGIDIPKWEQLMDAYLIDPRNNIPQTTKDRSSTRSKLAEVLLRSEQITWSSFQKGMKILQPKIVMYCLQVTIKGQTYCVTQRYLPQPIRLNLSGLAKK